MDNEGNMWLIKRSSCSGICEIVKSDLVCHRRQQESLKAVDLLHIAEGQEIAEERRYVVAAGFTIYVIYYKYVIW